MQQDPQPDPHIGLAQEYYRTSEDYDRQVCSLWDPVQCVALPVGHKELVQINSFALALRKRMEKEAGQDTFRDALRRYVRSGQLTRDELDNWGRPAFVPRPDMTIRQR